MTTQTERITLSLCDKHQIGAEMPSRDCDYPALDEGLDGISIAILLCIGGAGAILMLIGAYTVVRCIIGIYTVGRWLI